MLCSYCYVYVLLLCMFRSGYLIVFCVLFVCKCVLYYCHWVSTQLQLTNISYIYIHKMRGISWLAENLFSQVGVRLLVFTFPVGCVLYFLLFVYWRMIWDWFNFHKGLGFILSLHRPVAFSLHTILWTFENRCKWGNFMTIWATVGISKRLLQPAINF